MRIVEGNLDDPPVLQLLHAHVTRTHAETGRGSAHALDATGLKMPGIRFWSIWDGDRLLGIGALRSLSRDHGEVKSMHISEEASGQGTGAKLLRHIVRTAHGMGMTRLSLETGSWDYFAPARRFYRRHGFQDGPPFGDYKQDPNSVFLTMALMPAITIRPYDEGDFGCLTRIWLDGWKSTGVPAPVTLADLQELWRQEAAQGWSVHVALAEDAPMGYAGLRPGLLHHLYVDPAHQSKGIGKALLDFTKRQMPEGFALKTALHSRAPSFYEREGLVRGEISIHPRLGHEVVAYHWQP